MSDAICNRASTIARPEHRIHDTSDPLPGAKGATATVDYSAGTIQNAKFPPIALGLDKNSASEKGCWTGSPGAREDFRQNGFDSQTTPFTNRYETADDTVGPERQMHAQSQTHGGVSIDTDYRDDLPEGKAKLDDKIIGKTQKVLGKVSKKPEMLEKGELRETGGKAAVRGEARAPEHL
ncbi:hypothetical protein BDQ17DRAFT_1423074 [Cyathus striatus]|nr:hypothetical protein BDQ17DRAFT_1423074 [Cyathus striatus]